jgi:hypothetical protein
MDDNWYDALRERYRPIQIEILLIAESPPDPGSGKRRFFYSDTLTYDNLYRGVAEAAYGEEVEFDVNDKPKVLDRLRRDGFWLIDAVAYPVNKLPSGERRRAIRAAVPDLVRRCEGIRPRKGVIICHDKVFEGAAAELRRSGVTVLHGESLPFPLGNCRARFVAGFRAALRRAGVRGTGGSF